MRAQVVADIGNTRIKWGRCGSAGIDAVAALPPDDPSPWQHQAEAWGVGPSTWAIGSVQPQTLGRFLEWLLKGDHTAILLDSYRKVPIAVEVEAPARVGLDRLFNAVAARAQVPQGHAALIVDAGSAVTVDLVDEDGTFRGGAILPGLRLMARALNDYTAQLPLVEVSQVVHPPGASTEAAIQCGTAHAVLGGIDRLLRTLGRAHPQHVIFLTGGDAPLLSPELEVPHTLSPVLTLEGMRLSVNRSHEGGS